MSTHSLKAHQLQVRVSISEKKAIRKKAEAAGMEMSAWILNQILPPVREEFQKRVTALGHAEKTGFAFAELNDFFSGLSSSELVLAVESRPDLSALSPHLQNYLSAMIEEAAHQRGIPSPGWLREIKPLSAPFFATEMESLRLYLLVHSPPPYRKRNIFVDSGVGERV